MRHHHCYHYYTLGFSDKSVITPNTWFFMLSGQHYRSVKIAYVIMKCLTSSKSSSRNMPSFSKKISSAKLLPTMAHLCAKNPNSLWHGCHCVIYVHKLMDLYRHKQLICYKVISYIHAQYMHASRVYKSTCMQTLAHTDRRANTYVHTDTQCTHTHTHTRTHTHTCTDARTLSHTYRHTHK